MALVPSNPAQAGSEPRHSPPEGAAMHAESTGKHIATWAGSVS